MSGPVQGLQARSGTRGVMLRHTFNTRLLTCTPEGCRMGRRCLHVLVACLQEGSRGRRHPITKRPRGQAHWASVEGAERDGGFSVGYMYTCCTTLNILYPNPKYYGSTQESTAIRALITKILLPCVATPRRLGVYVHSPISFSNCFERFTCKRSVPAICRPRSSFATTMTTMNLGKRKTPTLRRMLCWWK